MFNLKWVNKYSQESGYVSKVIKSKGYFENTFEQSKAKKYRYKTEVEREIQYLNSIGEGDNNDFIPEEHKEIPVKKEVIKVDGDDTSVEFLEIFCPDCGVKMKRANNSYKCFKCMISVRKATVGDLVLKARCYLNERNFL